MAHTNSTSNYELSQFIGTDKPTFLGDYNGDMQKIDAAIKGAKDTADGASTTANAASALATSASETATTAASAAASADANATTALNTANGATTTANSALSAATTAASTASDAATTATAADTKATAAGTAQGTSYTAPAGSLATNVKEALDELYAGAGGEHGLYEIWVNPNPTSDFAAGNVVLSDFNETKYDAIEIEWAKDANEDVGIQPMRYEKSALVNNTLSTEFELGAVSAAGTMASYRRQFTITLDTTAHTLTFAFADAKKAIIASYGTAVTPVTDNSRMIPVRILGLAHNS